MKWVIYMENMQKAYDLILLVNGRLVLVRYELRRSNSNVYAIIIGITKTI
jgi:hypothetical protein